MNIICLDNNYLGCARPQQGPAWFLLSHSCLHRDQKPYYVPDWDRDFRAYPSAAIRIDRLGKGIPARFAERYWDHWTFGFSVRGTETLRALNEAGLPAGAALAFDCCAAIGRWMKADKEQLRRSSFTVETAATGGETASTGSETTAGAENETVARWSFADLILDADRSIEYVSRFITLKTGDIIFLGFPSEGIRLDRDFKINVKRSGPDTEDTISESFMGFNIRTTAYDGDILLHHNR